MTSIRRLLALSVFLGTVMSHAGVEAKKLSGAGRVVAVQSETKGLPGDHPAHEVSLLAEHEMDTSSDPLFDGVQVRVIGVSDYTAGNGPHFGYRQTTHPNGDLSFMAYEGKTTTVVNEDGSMNTTFEGTWRFIGGTGQFEGVQGSGTYRGQVTEAGPTYEFEGEYELAGE